MPATAHVVSSLIQLKRALRPRSRLLAAIEVAKREHFGLVTLDDLIVDLRYGGWCGGLVSAPTERSDAVRTQSTHYRILRKLFSHPLAHITPADVLVDLGCGKGRVINYWLDGGHRGPMMGIELRADVAGKTRARLRGHSNVQIVIGDAATVTPTHGTLYYLYNPFGEQTLVALAARLREMTRQPDKLRIVYHNAVHVNVFRKAGWRVTPVETGCGESGVIVTY